jgi:hypothetical protein
MQSAKILIQSTRFTQSNILRTDVGIIDDHGHLKRPPYPLALLETCRQIQQETTALAFSVIDFELSGMTMGACFPPCLIFLDGLCHEKRAAISTLVIDGMIPFGQAEAKEAKSLLGTILGQLLGLKRISVLMEHHEEDFDEGFGEDTGNADMQAFMISNIAMLQAKGQYVCDWMKLLLQDSEVLVGVEIRSMRIGE